MTDGGASKNNFQFCNQPNYCVLSMSSCCVWLSLPQNSWRAFISNMAASLLSVSLMFWNTWKSKQTRTSASGQDSHAHLMCILLTYILIILKFCLSIFSFLWFPVRADVTSPKRKLWQFFHVLCLFHNSGLDIKRAMTRYRAALASSPVAGFMVTYNKHTLSLEDLSTLEEQNWLNDQVGGRRMGGLQNTFTIN